ncbi:hypothetical protein CCM_03867 [Cordyceps militaris CM01]|uniref:Uncharacterized protein n=1 Tax=Cordyceps militaris (strain CM01) TaxID=983644 RepID=G3JCW6_CORMM|nr:uncharacterized protein CCM_03867 [Cordyceps militaris CM01]EGX92494.1 hypothetical protein CCM_03867 [Cordyceps militaris CM01]
MAEVSSAGAPSAILDIVLSVARSLWSVQWGRHLAGVARLIALPLSLITVPLSWVASAILVVSAPLLYLLGLLAASAQSTYSLLASLKPLYSFLSAAAGIGIVAGVVLGATSSVITSHLGMQDRDEGRYDRDRDRDSIDYYDEGDDDERDYLYDSDNYHLSPPSYQKPSDRDVGPKRRVAHGLLSQTIHEEDDSSGG